MQFTYHDPKTVVNPKKFIKKIDVLFDGKEQGFSLAMIDWEGLPHIGIRWNVAVKEQSDIEKSTGRTICNGSPSLNGVPSWFILPRELFNPQLFDTNSGHFFKLVEDWHSLGPTK